jgi:hypothetical protein
MLTEDFLKNSWPCVKAIVEKLATFDRENTAPQVSLFRFVKGRKTAKDFNGNHFFLRGSVEYSNPQLTVEEVQGIIGARLLEVCANYFHERGLRNPDSEDVAAIAEQLKKPTQGRVVAFLLNTDDIEPDRYSMNPLKKSLVSTGQSAFPAGYVKTDDLRIDREFVRKYEHTLISKNEVELVENELGGENSSYPDFVDSVKYAQLDTLSETFGIDLSLHSLRMPLETLQGEATDGLLHHIISETHRNFDAVKEAYDCMGRSIAKRTTLLTVPHSKLGYGSKRAARGKLYFDTEKLEGLSVMYKTTTLYPNAIDPNDVSVAQAEDSFRIKGEELIDYSFRQTPSSPQFFLYALVSPENAALWHGIGAFAAPKLLQSYSSVRTACREGRIIRNLHRFKPSIEVPMQFNLAPHGMWVHPVHRNIDASIGCVENMVDLARMGMNVEHLARFS